ncbi:hypothetical protein diail_11879 [Diaporthe ilicicola]|nr:hypothetical protein diail_11879 [Diaporthe ilicicola]
MLWQAGVTALLAVGAQAGGVADLVAEGVLTGRSRQAVEQRMGEHASDRIVVSRQASSTVSLIQNGTVNMAEWEAQVSTACQQALSKLPQSTNPSGTCTCYNLPALNTQTGAFEADLRLYQLSTPREDFTGIPANQVQVALSYNGASVSPVTSSTAAQKVSGPQARQAAGANTNLKLLQTYLFVGQVDPNKMQLEMNMAALEALVMPTVTLSAVNAAGQTVNTTVSSNEAAFVTGVFSNMVVLSETAKAQAAVDDVTRGLANGTIAFVLPGVNLLIFPIGLIICGAWTVIGAAVIGFGFFERVQYRESYRRRSAIANKGSMTKRI